MMEMLTFPFIQRAFIVSMLIGYLASFYGVFVVQRRLSFLGNGLAHSAFGGVALGILLNIEPIYIALPFTLLVALGITWLRENTSLNSDTSIGIFFSVSVALGIIFLSFKKEYTALAFNYLFGSILAVKEADIWITLGMVILSFLTWPLWSHWAYTTFDRELSLSDRLPVIRENYLLAMIIALVVALSLKIIGIMLIASFLIIPAASARLIARTFLQMTIISVILGVNSAWLGLFISYYADIPSGGAIILVQAFLFILAILYSFLRRN
jgi:zinc transport system permease protein